MKVSRHKEIQGYVLVVCMSLMSGCGTLMSERSGGFSGVREDMKIAKEPFFWIGSLGLLPMMGIASMPVDLAVDIVLYPFDVWLKNSLRVKDTPRPVGYSAPLYSINLTGGGDFDYAIWTYYDAPRNNTDFTKVTALQQPDSYTARAVSAPSPGGPVKPVAGVINPARLFSRYPYNSETTYSFHKLGPEYQGAEGERYRNTTKIKEAKLAPVDDVTDKSIIIFFMPCNELVLVRSDVPDYNPEALQLPGVQSLYKKLKKQSSLAQCPVPASTDKVVVVQG
ncbi:YceK/YidQ family lipoprotein [Pseudomonas lundensis]|uniref:YceK/YidQ family lipoprotein n=1 Tax=Pseudomonas lundensis TaxID=86185 RepID=UPI0009E4FE5F|nr:YceK/YidQ family lipoprotein [Pseudomonas lundensis]NLU00123.1 YceK/YidQ family lipoprotein [Pseudomonas lundensis]NNA07930.1 YceK/YidQ family lipoprotein [Pseudomonas lundensis]NNA32452.1 YceK/YidQ family lipoprotein [Pseudomonas lundensis]NNA41761.1 YceK/YidQ family lipoprotein [Pseudomonas lundensis]